MNSFVIGLCIVLTLSAAYAQDKPCVMVFLAKNPDAAQLSKSQSDKISSEHLHNLGALAKEGKLLAAGPFEGGGGFFLMNTASVEEARQWIASDPGIQANRWTIELMPYTTRIGKPAKVAEPNAMVMYEFIRFDAEVSKFTASTFPEIIARHAEFLKRLEATGNVITAGIFGDYDGGILIMKGDLQREVIEADPGVQEGLLHVTYKQLWIAKGSFGER